MDSFYEVFSRTPVPRPNRNPNFTPEVPEVSLIFDKNSLIEQPYNQNSFKEVRFNNSNQDIIQSSLSKQLENNACRKKGFQDIYMANVPNQKLDLSLIDVNLKTKSLTRVNVEKDNSICKKESVPTTYKEYLQMHKNDYVSLSNANEKNNIKNGQTYDIFNYKRDDNVNYESLKNKHYERRLNIADNDITTQNVSKNTSSRNVISPKEASFTYNSHHFKNSNADNNKKESKDVVVQTIAAENNEIQVQNIEPSIKDLMKIIQQQNAQMLVLQQQVATLLEKESKRNASTSIDKTNDKMPQKSNTQESSQANNRFHLGGTPRKGPLPKFSIDLMTSFEVSFRPQPNVFHRKMDYKNIEPKIQEITECDSVDNEKKDLSMNFKEPISIREMCPSPEPSIDIQMQDYSESDEEDNEVNLTIYKDLMDQINNVLMNKNVSSKGFSGSKSENQNNITENIDVLVLKEIQKQLKKIGISLESVSHHFNCSETGTDFNVQRDDLHYIIKQLLMKYLPNEFLNKALEKNNKQIKLHSDKKQIPDSRSPQFSFATVEFMKKYNLISNGNAREKVCTSIMKKSKIPNKSDFKILSDISKLKMQPKLL